MLSLSGYILIFRELNDNNEYHISTLFANEQKVAFNKVFGDGENFTVRAGLNGLVEISLPKPNSFCLYKYRITE